MSNKRLTRFLLNSMIPSCLRYDSMLYYDLNADFGASKAESRRAAGKPVVCSVCHTYGGTMYKRGDGYICRDCKRKEQKNDRKAD